MTIVHRRNPKSADCHAEPLDPAAHDGCCKEANLIRDDKTETANARQQQHGQFDDDELRPTGGRFGISRFEPLIEKRSAAN